MHDPLHLTLRYVYYSRPLFVSPLQCSTTQSVGMCHHLTLRSVNLYGPTTPSLASRFLYILEVHMGWSMHRYDDIYFSTQEPQVTPAAPLRFRESCSPLCRCHAWSNVDDLITPCAKFVRAYAPSRSSIAPWPTTRMLTMLAT